MSVTGLHDEKFTESHQRTYILKRKNNNNKRQQQQTKKRKKERVLLNMWFPEIRCREKKSWWCYSQWSRKAQGISRSI